MAVLSLGGWKQCMGSTAAFSFAAGTMDVVAWCDEGDDTLSWPQVAWASTLLFCLRAVVCMCF